MIVKAYVYVRCVRVYIRCMCVVYVRECVCVWGVCLCVWTRVTGTINIGLKLSQKFILWSLSIRLAGNSVFERGRFHMRCYTLST